MAEKFRVKGLRKALETMERLPDHVAPKGGGPVMRALFRASLEWKKQMESNAAQLGPGKKNSRTGSVRLKDSIVRIRDREPEREGYVARVFVTPDIRKAWWAPFVELGTNKQGAQPFMRPVLDQAGQKPVRIFADTLSRSIEGIVAELSK